jgi:CheY-like chemotaxis protein
VCVGAMTTRSTAMPCQLLAATPASSSSVWPATAPSPFDCSTELSPNVVVMDLRMRGMDGLEATRRSTTESPHIAVLVLSMRDDDFVFSPTALRASPSMAGTSALLTRRKRRAGPALGAGFNRTRSARSPRTRPGSNGLPPSTTAGWARTLTG